MNRFLLTAVLLLSLLDPLHAQQSERSASIVYINGAKYYVHTVVRGDTFYSLARLYDVDEAAIRNNNPAAVDGLKIDQTLKIPFRVEADPAPTSSDRKLRRTFVQHEVRAGETLYAISRRYEISVETIIEDNPSIDPARLSIGQVLLIRKKQIGKSDEEQSRSEWAGYAERLNSVAGDGYQYRIVQPKETVWSISRQYGITEAELLALNDLSQGLRAGAIIRVPMRGEAGELPQAPSSEAGGRADTVAASRTGVDAVFRALRPAERLQVALLLPLAAEGGTPHAGFAEFYKGFLLGLEDVKERGLSVDLTLFNTARDSARMERIVRSNEFRRAQLIVGPVYEEELPAVLDYAEREQVPVISPLANLESQRSDVLFQLAPSPAHKYDKIVDLLSGDHHVTLIRTDETDAEFEHEILPLLANKDYSNYTYRYIQGSDNAEVNDLTPLLRSHEKNFFIVLAEREVDVDRILASLASACTNIVARGLTPPEFVVLGHARWNRFVNVDLTTFFKNRVVLLSTYHARRESEAVHRFDSRYIRAYGQLPSLYSYRGYDAAVIFCQGMYSDIQYDMEGRRFTPLQTTYSFAQEPGSDTHVNREWMRIDYNNDFTVTIR